MNPQFKITNKMLNYIIEISKQLGLIQFELGKDLHLRKENKILSIQSSLAIENNSLTIEQITDIIDGKRVLGKPQEIQEVKNAYEAYEMITKFDPYNMDSFLKAHKIMTRDLIKSAGNFRQKDIGVFDNEGNIVHLGARPQFIFDLMVDLFKWSKKDNTPELIKSCVIHYEIEAIHPFEDGNGRIGRMWQSVVLCKWNPIFEFVPIETIVYENQQGYYKALAKADDENDSTYFIEFMLEMIFITIKKYSNKKMSDIVSDKMSDKMNEEFIKIKEYLNNNDFLTSKDAVRIIGMSEATVRRYLNKYVELGLISAKGQNKARKYYIKK